MKVRLRMIWAAAIVIGIFAQGATADPLRFAVVEWGGLTYRDARGQPTGPWFDMMVAITDDLSMETELLVLPLPRIFRRLDHGETDLTLFTTNIGAEVLKVDPAAEHGYHRVALVHRDTGIVVVGRKDLLIKDYHDLNGMRAAIGIGGCCFQGFSDNDAIEKLQVPDNVILKMIDAGRVDAGVLLDLDYNYYVTHAGFDIDRYSRPVLTTPLEAWVHRRHDFTDDVALSKVRATVDRLYRNGTFQEILARYRPGS